MKNTQKQQLIKSIIENLENEETEEIEIEEDEEENEELSLKLTREPILYSSTLKDYQTKETLGPYYAYD